MAWSDAARAAAREARRLRGGQQGIERRYRRSTGRMNLAGKQVVKIGDTLAKLESKMDSWGREKHASTQIALQEKQRAMIRRARAWRSANNAYRAVLGKEKTRY